SARRGLWPGPQDRDRHRRRGLTCTGLNTPCRRFWERRLARTSARSLVDGDQPKTNPLAPWLVSSRSRPAPATASLAVQRRSSSRRRRVSPPPSREGTAASSGSERRPRTPLLKLLPTATRGSGR